VIKQDDMKKVNRFLKVTITIDKPKYNIKTHNDFKDIISPFDVIEKHIKVTTNRYENYMDWRYNKNPFIRYEYTNLYDENLCNGYIISRHECFYPTKFYATRIIDAIGNPCYIQDLLKSIIDKAIERNDLFIDFLYAGTIFDDALHELGFIELTDDTYNTIPVVSDPMDFRLNDEFICLKCKDKPLLFEDIGYDDIYFTKGDSDRDRINKIR
jgi:hypothetical protein